MSLTRDAEADRRWAAAQSIADGVMDERMSRRRRNFWLWISAAMVGTWILAFALIAVLPGPTDDPRSDDGWINRAIVGLTIQGIGLLIAIAGLIWAARTHRYITRWRQVASPLNRKERKWAMKQIRSVSPIDDERKSRVVLAVAAQNRRITQGLLPLYFGLSVSFLGTGMASRWSVTVWLALITVLAYVALFAILARDYRRAGAYLERFGVQPPGSGHAEATL